MNFVRGVFSSTPTISALPIRESAVPLSYVLSSFRWHLDSRPPSKAILVHDFLGSSVAWQQLLHKNLGRLPLSNLTLKTPLELYAVNLREHYLSKGLPCPAEAKNYALACAADIVLHQRQILRSDAKLAGLGFGALVACQAALHSPESGFESLTLFVNDPSQLVACDPSQYPTASVILGVPKEIKTLAELNRHLSKTVPNPVERALIFASAEQRDGAISFRFGKELLGLQGPLQGAVGVGERVQFLKQVTVVQCSDAVFPQEAKDRFTKHFPNATFLKFEGDRSAGLSGLYLQGEPFVGTLLRTMNMLAEAENGEGNK
ncbi:hypothetical protein DQ04_00071150 [Trypanosoma grayi]|uniref:hypothetical protein n=1 Tax=Trypanosoma grayi TaxID=71804 RepID=UPI0004F43E23|nr:hypothetical protein DQ04_00071150 [Trypanosoma grayi]KEG15447.1 hypothetical protein DQ04_00071150 [Trypanosoma grayi]